MRTTGSNEPKERWVLHNLAPRRRQSPEDLAGGEDGANSPSNKLVAPGAAFFHSSALQTLPSPLFPTTGGEEERKARGGPWSRCGQRSSVPFPPLAVKQPHSGGWGWQLLPGGPGSAAAAPAPSSPCRPRSPAEPRSAAELLPPPSVVRDRTRYTATRSPEGFCTKRCEQPGLGSFKVLYTEGDSSGG